VAHQFALDLTLHNAARLVAVSSRSLERGQAAARAMGDVKAVEGYDALLAMPEVETVYIATPNHRHKDDCLAALAAGKHVLCEKPLAMNEAEAREIAAAAARAGRFCMEGLWTHFIPAFIEAERLIHAGAIGEPHLLSATFGIPVRDPSDPVVMPNGGALLDRGCYPISLALRLFGPVQSVRGAVMPGPDGADLAAAATLSFAGGQTAQISASLVDQFENRLFIGATRGSITLDKVTAPAMVGLRQTAMTPKPMIYDAGLNNRVRRMVRGVVSRSSSLTRLRDLMHLRPRMIPPRGYGFVHEIAEVQACLAAGRLQSAVHPLARSIETLRVIDRIGALG
jgi:predicted dehydrogenase